MSVDHYDCAFCSNTGVYEEYINCCEGCGERLCTDCANNYDEETCKLLDCPICWKIALDAANPHKDFLGKSLNEGDNVVYISYNCDRYTKWKITWFFKDQAIIQNQWMTTTKKMFKFIIKV